MRLPSPNQSIRAIPGHGHAIEAGLWVGIGVLFTLILLYA